MMNCRTRSEITGTVLALAAALSLVPLTGYSDT